MFIVPISELQPVMTASEPNQQKAGASGFDGVLKNAIENLEATQKASREDAIALALGETDDLHTVQINSMKATAAIELTAAVTSKVLSAYQSVMNMQM